MSQHMRSELQQYLDAEVARDDLPAELRAEADEWDELLRSAEQLRHVRAPFWLETQIMAALPATPAMAWHKRVRSWFLQPQPLRVRPVTAMLAGSLALLAVLLLQPSPGPTGADELAPSARTVSAAPQPVIYVQFVFADANARSVAVAGDFNDWEAQATLLTDYDGDGVWTGLVALRPGLHKYMFVVDGERWVTDPEAERYIDDGFGMRNAVISVAAPSARAI